ncbi:MAG: TauD/TfdA family dioxygenase [Burkholderiales bacterium]|nr:TauD/TfdA family dioxygenase [Burkholderiales bacterium]
MSPSTDFEVKPLPASFGAVVTGLVPGRLDAAGFERLYQTWLEYALLIFPGIHLSKEEQVAFARRFGAPEFELAAISNVRSDGSVRVENDSDDVIKVLKGNMGWHCDSTYMPVQAKGAVFTAHVVPSSGGETGWADMRAAHDALDPAMRTRIAGLSARHSLHYSQAKLGHQAKAGSEYSGYGFQVKDPPLRPLVKIHPETGRPALMIGRHAYGIPGLGEQESDALLQELLDFACQAPRVHHHHWAPGDAVIWDNRCLMHRATPWDMREPRIMYHSRIAGDPVSEFAAPA